MVSLVYEQSVADCVIGKNSTVPFEQLLPHLLLASLELLLWTLRLSFQKVLFFLMVIFFAISFLGVSFFSNF